MARRRPRPTDPETRYRNMLEASGLPALAGLSRLGLGSVGGGVSTIVGSVLSDGSESSLPEAQMLILSATGASIASGGDYVTFDTIEHQRGFSGVSTAGETITWPTSVIGVVEVSLAWDTYTGASDVELEVDGAVPAWGLVGSGSGSSGSKTRAVDIASGQVLKVKVTQSSGTAKLIDATVTCAVFGPVTTEDRWVRLFSADAYGLTRLNGSWWTTEGDGETVSERNSSGTQLSSFEATHIDTGGIEGPVRGIGNNGTDLWVVGESNVIVVRYNTSGTLQSSFNPSWSGELEMAGITFDGTDLWISGSTNEAVRRYTTGGTYQEEIAAPAGSDIKGVAYHAGRLFVTDFTTDAILIYDLATDEWSGSVAAPVTNPTGVYVDESGSLYLSKDGDGVYRYRGSP